MSKDEVVVKNNIWVLRRLKEYGNCYIRSLNRVNIPELEEQLHTPITARRTSKDCEGYILEIRKDNMI